MSLFLRLACFRSTVRTTINIKRFYWTSHHGLTIPEEVRIRYFIPRTIDDTADSVKQPQKDSRIVNEKYKIIYKLPNENIIPIFSYCALCATALILFFIFDYKHVFQQAEDEKTAKDCTVSEDLTLEDDSSFSKPMKKINTSDVIFFQNVYSGNPKAKLAVALMMIIIFFNVRSRIALSIYRHNNEFISVFYKPLGFKKELIAHEAKDCCYYPNGKLFNYNLFGKNIFIFPEFFINNNEEKLYAGRRSQ